MTTIITKHGSGAPAALDLSQGELAIDLTNKELYTKDGDGNVIKVSGTGGGEAGTFTDLTATSSFTSPGIDDNATSTAVTINASQKVGIGTDDPQQLLEVSASLNPVIRLDSSLVGNENDFDNTFMGGVEWYTNDTTGIGEHIGASLRAFSNASVATTTPGYELIFSTSLADVAESEAMRIDGNGNVGIGTGSLSLSRNLTVYDASAGAVSDLIALRNGAGTVAGSGGAIVGVNDDDINVARIAWEAEGSGSGGLDPAAITFDTRSVGGSLTERMRYESLRATNGRRIRNYCAYKHYRYRHRSSHHDGLVRV